MVVEKEVVVNFYGKLCLPVFTWNKKHSSKQVLPKTHTLEKKLFAGATFDGLWVNPFSDRLKN